MIADFLAEWLFNMEEQAKLKQIEYIAQFAKAIVKRDVAEMYMPKVYQPVIEPEDCYLVAVFYEGLEGGKIAYHLVFRDERVPVKQIDERYRKLRLDKYGRTTDVESIIIDLMNLTVIFRSTYASSEPYELSLHFSAVEPYSFSKGIYVSTWNHMMRVKPSAWVNLRGGYTEIIPEVVEQGRRRKAEKFEV